MSRPLPFKPTRPFTTTSMPHPDLALYHPYSAPHLSNPMAAALSRPRPLGPVGRWYLPAMAVIALGWTLASEYAILRLGGADWRNQGFAAANAWESRQDRHGSAEVSGKANNVAETARQAALLDAYGDRGSLEELQKAMEAYQRR
ncbi:hypothetical protein BDY21DRAFT_372432 [Lineolata rhizophorae]|uniref:Uncharacterized protein n=1 Tax=Lineolata rhizophorae TaxID=578093 RepID=A0A6A6NXN7_9PEZI|nr:hypothetical protein BDY21DRAFT_372432 [Lineolata rhizophorae]